MQYLIAAALFFHAAWVFFDAHKRRRHTLREAAVWAAGTLVLWLFIVPLYFAKRNLKAGETREGGTGWNYLKSLVVLWTIVMAVVGVHYILAASEVASTAHTGAAQAGAAIGITLGVGILAAVWLFPVVGALILGLVLKKASIVEKGPTGPLVQGTGAATPGLTACPTCGNPIMKGAPCPTCDRKTRPKEKLHGTVIVAGVMASVLVLGLLVLGLLKSLGTATELREEKYPNGSLKSRGHVRQDADKNHVLVGLWTYWFPNGQKEAEGDYRNGREGGKRGDTGLLVDGRNGPWTIWYENGQKRSASTYQDGKQEGVWTAWYESGQKKEEGRYEDGKQEGVWIAWYENGQKKEEGTFKDDKLDGRFRTWHENGRKRQESSLKAGKLDGPSTVWYENGQKEEESTFKDDELDGPSTTWYENGQNKVAATFAHGGIVGPALVWSEDGRRIRDSAPATLSAEPAVVTDNSDSVHFGKPTVRDTGFGMTRVMVQVRNVTDRPVTCLVTATFLKGDTILGTANGTVNAIGASSVKTAQLMTMDRIRGYDTVRLETGGCF